MEFDLDRTLRRVKPERHAAQLDRRPDAELAFVDDEPLVGSPLLLDTCVYIHVLRGRTPARMDDLLRTRTLHHSATVLAELTNRLDSRLPTNARERKARETLAQAIREIPPHRMITPTASMWGEAGIIAGLRARVGGFAQAGGQDTLNDALILLQATGIGAAVLTAHTSDFDILQQLAPTGRVLFYKEAP